MRNVGDGMLQSEQAAPVCSTSGRGLIQFSTSSGTRTTATSGIHVVHLSLLYKDINCLIDHYIVYGFMQGLSRSDLAGKRRESPEEEETGAGQRRSSRRSASPSAKRRADERASSRVLPVVPTSTSILPGVTCWLKRAARRLSGRMRPG